MVYDFLINCKCALNEETDDFREVIDKIQHMQNGVGFMPAITDDLYPVFSLSCMSAKTISSPDIFIIPVGTGDSGTKLYFQQIVNKFYQDDEIREQYDVELEEMILLKSSDISDCFLLNEKIAYNIVYCSITMRTEESKYLIVVLDTPHGCWQKIVEVYNIKCEILIDSHKGMGDWFEYVPLYKVMRETKRTDLLPHYYFKGLYISHEAPLGFNLMCTIPDVVVFNGHPIDNWQKEIYDIDWEENRKASD